MRRLAGLALLLAAAFAAPFALPQAGAGVLRYHYGDNPVWADPAFDDSGWPVAEDARVPAPPFNSDGYVWIRTRISIPAGLSMPLAIQTSVDAGHRGVPVGVVEIYVSGKASGQVGEFPPQASPRILPRSITLPLDPALSQPGQIASVAVREWAPPDPLVRAASRPIAVSIDRDSVLATAARADNADALLASQPMFVPNLLLILLGLALLGLCPVIRSRELLLNAIWLITLPVYVGAAVLSQAGLISPPFISWLLIFFFLRIPGFWVTVELIWTVHRIPSRLSRALAHACWIAYLVPELIASSPVGPSHGSRPWSSLHSALSPCSTSSALALTSGRSSLPAAIASSPRLSLSSTFRSCCA